MFDAMQARPTAVLKTRHSNTLICGAKVQRCFGDSLLTAEGQVKHGDKAERKYEKDMVGAWQEQTMVRRTDWDYLCRMLDGLSNELGRKRVARLMYSMADQLHHDASAGQDVGAYWLDQSGAADLPPGKRKNNEWDELTNFSMLEISKMVWAVRYERRRLHEALPYRSENPEKLNWPKFGAMIDDLKYRLGPSDAGWLISELGDSW